MIKRRFRSWAVAGGLIAACGLMAVSIDHTADGVDADALLSGPVDVGRTAPGDALNAVSGFCLGDLDGNAEVNVQDLLVLLANWGPCESSIPCKGDLNGDGVIDVLDLLLLLANWGSCQKPCVTPSQCDDGNLCTVNFCIEGNCLTIPIDCDDGNACTANTCNPMSGCFNPPLSCDDGNPCTANPCDPSVGCLSTPIPGCGP